MSNGFQSLIKKARFYLTFEPWHAPADGLYVYRQSPNNNQQLDCWHINGTNKNNTGKVRKHKKLNLQKPLKQVGPGTRFAGPISSLLFKTSMPKPNGEEETVFFSLERIDPQNQVWFRQVGPLKPEKKGAVKYELPIEIRRELHWLSRKRHQTFDKLVVKLWAGNQSSPMVSNAEPCWQSLSSVSDAMIECLKRSLLSDNDDQSVFRNPSWVFQLHRVLVEGRIKGHYKSRASAAALGYVTQKDSYETWQVALKEAKQGYTWDNDNDKLPPKARRAFLVIAWWYTFGWLDEFLDWAMPGGTEAKEYCFIRMHYAHWYCDLLWAMKKYGEGRYPDDWYLPYEIIINNFTVPTVDSGQAVLDVLIRFANRIAKALEDHEGPLDDAAVKVADGVIWLKHLTVSRVINDLKDLA